MDKFKNTVFLGLSLISVGLAGCSAIGTAVSHRNLDVQTNMSDTVFLKPLMPDQKIAYVDVHNTSNQSSFDITSQIKSSVSAKGYKLTDNPDDAYVLLQVNVLKVSKSNADEAKGALSGGYGSALGGAAVGAAGGALVGQSNTAMIGGGLVGALVGTVEDGLVKDTFYTMVTDVQISEKLKEGQVASEETTANTKQGSSTQSVTHLSATSNFMVYRTRVVSTADKVNLEFADAKSALEVQLSHSIANIL